MDQRTVVRWLVGWALRLCPDRPDTDAAVMLLTDVRTVLDDAGGCDG